MMSSIARVRLVAALLLSLASAFAFAQNAAIVNGKAIPTKKVDELVQMLTAQGRPDTPELRAAVRDELIARELFVQEGTEVRAGDRLTILAEFFPSAPLTSATDATPACSVPALIVVAPVYVFAPDSVSVCPPLFVSPPAPLITPPMAILPVLAVFTVRVPLNASGRFIV